jgi:hypothetical protein
VRGEVGGIEGAADNQERAAVSGDAIRREEGKRELVWARDLAAELVSEVDVVERAWRSDVLGRGYRQSPGGVDH